MENFPSNITDKRTVSYASLRTRHGPLIGGYEKIMKKKHLKFPNRKISELHKKKGSGVFAPMHEIHQRFGEI